MSLIKVVLQVMMDQVMSRNKEFWLKKVKVIILFGAQEEWIVKDF